MGFADQIKQFSVKVENLSHAVVSDCVNGVAFKVDERSPVDTGHFRANWQLGVGTMPAGQIAGVDPTGAGLGNRVTARIPADAAGKVYYLTNNLPYAQRLEMGYSKQAPQGMVGRTVTEWQGLVDKAVQAVKARHP